MSLWSIWAGGWVGGWVGEQAYQGGLFHADFEFLGNQFHDFFVCFDALALVLPFQAVDLVGEGGWVGGWVGG